MNRKLQLADRAKGARLGAANELMRAKTSSRRFERYLFSIRSDEGLTLAASVLLSFFILMALINSFDTKTGSRAGAVARFVCGLSLLLVSPGTPVFLSPKNQHF